MSEMMVKQERWFGREMIVFHRTICQFLVILNSLITNEAPRGQEIKPTTCSGWKWRLEHLHKHKTLKSDLGKINYTHKKLALQKARLKCLLISG